MSSTGNQSLSINQRRNTRLNEYLAVLGMGDTFLIARHDEGENYDDHPLLARYRVKMLHRFPGFDHEDNPFPANLGLFCLPGGLKLSLEMMLPTFFAFVHTRANGQHMFGYCLTFHEALEPPQRKALGELVEAFEHKMDRAGAEVGAGVGNGQGTVNQPAVPKLQPGQAVYAPKCLCLLSCWPYFTSYRDWLTNLYRISLSPTHIPLERYVCNFLLEVPNATPGRVEVVYNMGTATPDIAFACPPPNKPTAWAALPLEPLFQSLDLENVALCFECVLLEKSVLLKSSQLYMLTTCAEVLTLLIYPFSWSHVYIPVVPESLMGVIHAPMPFLIGVHSSFLEGVDLPSHVIIVDLDNNTVDLGEGNWLPPLPQKRKAKLLQSLQECADFSKCRTPEWLQTVRPQLDLAFAMAVKPADFAEEDEGQKDKPPDWDGVREAFLRLFVSLLKTYRRYLVFPTKEDPTPSQMFLRKDFLEKMDPEHRLLLDALCDTQAFQNFIDARIQPDPDDLDVVYFDESIEAKRNRSRLQVIKKDTQFLSTEAYEKAKTVVALGPDTSGLNMEDKPILYHRFPDLNDANYTIPRDVPSLSQKAVENYDPKKHKVKARKSSGVFRISRLEDSVMPSTPEATVFSVWIMGFSAIAGREPIKQGAGPLIRHLIRGGSSVSHLSTPPVANGLPTPHHQAPHPSLPPRTPLDQVHHLQLPHTPLLLLPRPPFQPPLKDPIFGRTTPSPSTSPNRRHNHQRASSAAAAAGTELSPRSVGRRQSSLVSTELISPLKAFGRKLSLRPNGPEPESPSPTTAPPKKNSRYAEDPDNDLAPRTAHYRRRSSAEGGEFGEAYTFAATTLFYGRRSIELLEVLGTPDQEERLAALKEVVTVTPEPATEEVKEDDKGKRVKRLSSSALAGLGSDLIWDLKEERQHAANAALLVSFEVLELMSKHSLEIEEVVYRSLISACGRCGNSEKAMQVVEMMLGAGIMPDAMVSRCLVDAFASDENYSLCNPFDLLDWSKFQAKPSANRSILGAPWEARDSKVTDTVGSGGGDKKPEESKFNLRRFLNRLDHSYSIAKGGKEGLPPEGGPPKPVKPPVPVTAPSGSKSPVRRPPALGAVGGSMGGLSTPRSSNLRRISGDGKGSGGPLHRHLQQDSMRGGSTPGTPSNSLRSRHLSDMSQLMQHQLDLGEALMALLFPDLQIETEQETCPQCQQNVRDRDIQAGWEPDPNVYTTRCPCINADGTACGRKFVAKFCVRSSDPAWEGSTGQGTTLWCEYLPPWVLRKEVHTLLMSYGIEFLCSPGFRLSKGPNSTNSTIFWNLVVHLRQYCLPITFLLAGPFAGGVLVPALSGAM